MGIATAIIDTDEEFQRVLDTPVPVFMLFVSQHCPACADAGPLFTRVASQYPQIKSMVLDTAETLRRSEVTGTPTLAVYRDGALMETFKGLGPEEDQPQLVEEIFKRYAENA
ncbi:thioredoxin family protein [Pseudomonas sp. P115]|uniref:thioredoxin family protein n=1 Tax=Pseudomonas pisciculturae TaxID=2730413 RepID=UPI001357090C|nr:thioredoxin family protein [Pseudomonas pisciculturae]MBF6029034.1 thioredoxin family protein [Pseudomonas pisciculturae]